MGAVQPHAPDTSSVDDGTYVYMYGHCVDEYDTMCYADGSPKDLRYECPESQERLLDCGDDTYFNTIPSNGSYLDEHWNPAMAAFLVRTGSGRGVHRRRGLILLGIAGWPRPGSPAAARPISSASARTMR